MSGWSALAGASGLLLLVTWLLYPALILLVAPRTKRSGRPGRRPHPRVSVILATREPPEVVRRRVEDLLRTAYPPALLDILVSIDGPAAGYSLDGLGSSPAHLHLLGRDDAAGKATALNAGVARATGGILVFTDAHQEFEPDAIPRLVEGLDDPAFGAVSGSLALGSDDKTTPMSRYWELESRLRGAEARIHSAIGVTGAIYALRAELWKPLPAGLLLDDLYLPMRLILEGHRIGYAPTARAIDRRTTGPGQEYLRKVRTLTGNIQLCLWLPRVLNPLRNPVWPMFVCHKLLRLLTPYALAGLAVGGAGILVTAAPTVAAGVLAAGILVTAWAWLSRGTLGRRIREGLKWMAAMQGAVVVASLNGLRGRWDVWPR